MPEALRTIVELMRSAKSEKVRLDATTTLLALAGVRPEDGVEEEKPARIEQQRPAVLLNLFLGGGEEKPIRVIEGHAREVGAPVRLAREVVQALMQGLLLRGNQMDQRQIAYDFLSDQSLIAGPHSRWEDVTEKERRSHTRFAQRTIRVEEVAREWQAEREAIGAGVDARDRGHGKPASSPPLSKEEAIDYLTFVEQKVIRRIPVIDLEEADSGFPGIRVDKLEWQFVNIRHIQQHTGELYERLGACMDIKLDWAERRHGPRSPKRAP